MERKKFFPLEFEIVLFEVDDIVRTSDIYGEEEDLGGLGGGNGGNEGGDAELPWN